jgi:hypothetical protein
MGDLTINVVGGTAYGWVAALGAHAGSKGSSWSAAARRAAPVTTLPPPAPAALTRCPRTG